MTIKKLVNLIDKDALDQEPVGIFQQLVAMLRGLV